MSHPVIHSSERSIIYDAIAGASFEVPFPVFDYDDLEVYVDGNLRNDWTETGEEFTCGVASSGRITLDENVTGQVSIVSRRNPRRENDYVEGAGLTVDALNTDLDRLTSTDQELHRDLRVVEDDISDETSARISEDAKINAALKKTMRFGKDIPATDLGRKCTVLSWIGGKPAWVTLDSLIAQKYVVSQGPMRTITEHDVKAYGLYFGPQPKVLDDTKWIEFTTADLNVPESTDWCDHFVNPPICDDPFAIEVSKPFEILETEKPETEGDPWKFRVRVPVIVEQGTTCHV